MEADPSKPTMLGVKEYGEVFRIAMALYAGFKGEVVIVGSTLSQERAMARKMGFFLSRLENYRDQVRIELVDPKVLFKLKLCASLAAESPRRVYARAIGYAKTDLNHLTDLGQYSANDPEGVRRKREPFYSFFSERISDVHHTVTNSVNDYLDSLSLSRNERYILIWSRNSFYKAERNLKDEEFNILLEGARAKNCRVLVFGQVSQETSERIEKDPFVINFEDFYSKRPFLDQRSICSQIEFFWRLRENLNIDTGLGIVTGPMIGLVMLDFRVFYLIKKRKNTKRMEDEVKDILKLGNSESKYMVFQDHNDLNQNIDKIDSFISR